MSDENSLMTGGVSAEFWAVPEAFITDPNLQLLHAESCRRLRDENPQADTLELMAIERVTSLYFYMRSKETAGQYNSDAAYKGMMQLWVQMASELRKTRLGTADADTIRAGVLQTVATAISGALEGLEPEVAKTVRRRLSERLERV